MKESILPFLACPQTGDPLTLTVSERDGEEIISGVLHAPKGHEYPILRGVPRLVVDFSDNFEKVQTQSSFSNKWHSIPTYGFDDATRSHFLNWYLTRHGFGDAASLSAFLNGRRFILDAGTGAGRDASFFAECAPHATVFGIDLSESVEHAFHNTRNHHNVHIIQADLTKLPFQRGLFDYLSCDQVLHHTPNTYESFRALLPFVAQGGELAIYVYKIKAPIREFADDFLRQHFTDSSEEEALAFSRQITLLGKALSDLKATIDIPEDIPILGIEAGSYDLQRWIFYTMFKCFWNDDMPFEINVAANYDWYRPKHAFRHTPQEVRAWYDEAGLEVVNFDVEPAGISARGIRLA